MTYFILASRPNFYKYGSIIEKPHHPLHDPGSGLEDVGDIIYILSSRGGYLFWAGVGGATPSPNLAAIPRGGGRALPLYLPPLRCVPCDLDNQTSPCYDAIVPRDRAQAQSPTDKYLDKYIGLPGCRATWTQVHHVVHTPATHNTILGGLYHGTQEQSRKQDPHHFYPQRC